MLQFLAAAAAVAVQAVVAHSHVDYLIINGEMFKGFIPNTTHIPADVVGWSTSVTDDGFVPPENYTLPDIICHRDGAPAKAHAPVRAGDRVHVQWNGWPKSHAGPAMSYLAPCAGTQDGCASVDKTTLRWSLIDNSAPAFLNESGGPPGWWISDVIISQNNSYQVEIPPTLAPGPYVLRHELIALHYASKLDGAQNYPQCLNLWVLPSAGTAAAVKTVVTTAAKGVQVTKVETNTAAAAILTATAGALSLPSSAGMPATELYHSTDPGIFINIFLSMTTYTIPGPTVISGAAPVVASMQHKSVPTAGGTAVAITGGSVTVPVSVAPAPKTLSVTASSVASA